MVKPDKFIYICMSDEIRELIERLRIEDDENN